MLITFKRFMLNKFLDLLPSSCFGYRRFILRLMNVKVSRSAKVNSGFRIYGPGKVELDDEVWIGQNCRIYTAGFNNVTIGSKTEIGPETIFNCQSHDTQDPLHRAGKCIMHDITIGNGSWIGTRSTIIARQIGNGVVIGAGAVVKDDIPDNCLAAGIPAKVKKSL